MSKSLDHEGMLDVLEAMVRARYPDDWIQGVQDADRAAIKMLVDAGRMRWKSERDGAYYYFVPELEPRLTEEEVAEVMDRVEVIDNTDNAGRRREFKHELRTLLTSLTREKQ